MKVAKNLFGRAGFFFGGRFRLNFDGRFAFVIPTDGAGGMRTHHFLAIRARGRLGNVQFMGLAGVTKSFAPGRGCFLRSCHKKSFFVNAKS
jgi:hypothetical protein